MVFELLYLATHCGLGNVQTARSPAEMHVFPQSYEIAKVAKLNGCLEEPTFHSENPAFRLSGFAAAASVTEVRKPCASPAKIIARSTETIGCIVGAFAHRSV